MYAHSKSAEKQLEVMLIQRNQNRYLIASAKVIVLGMVRMGMEFGLLAVDAAGDYIRVNGSNVVTLDPDRVRSAVRRSGAPIEKIEQALNATQVHRKSATVVAFKKRRIAVLPI